MNPNLKKARKKWGVPKFEQSCGATLVCGKKTKKYKVPGTPEHGKYCALMAHVHEDVRLMNAIIVEEGCKNG